MIKRFLITSSFKRAVHDRMLVGLLLLNLLIMLTIGCSTIWENVEKLRHPRELAHNIKDRMYDYANREDKTPEPTTIAAATPTPEIIDTPIITPTPIPTETVIAAVTPNVRNLPTPIPTPYTPPENPALSKRYQVAMIIGIDKYDKMRNLKNAVDDAKAVANILKGQYGFSQIYEMYDKAATRRQIEDTFKRLIADLKGGEDILIYFSGHGYYNETLNSGYWIPVDAKNELDYMPNSRIHDYIKAMDRKKARNIFLVADSCFSGTFIGTTRALRVTATPRPYALENDFKFLNKPYLDIARQALTSGSNEPVLDGGAEGHSVFAYYLLDALKKPDYSAFSATELSTKVQRNVGANADQSPRLGIIKYAGHANGEFVFVKKK